MWYGKRVTKQHENGFPMDMADYQGIKLVTFQRTVPKCVSVQGVSENSNVFAGFTLFREIVFTSVMQ
jgi:hypothetical protein